MAPADREATAAGLTRRLLAGSREAERAAHQRRIECSRLERERRRLREAWRA